MAENYKILYEQMKKMVKKYQDNIVPGLLSVIERLEAERQWISVEEDGLPENSKEEGAFCPRYFVMTKYGESLGWYNPNFKSWFVLFWFFTDRLLAEEIDFERADVPKIVKVPDGVVTHWMPLPKPQKAGSGGKA